MVRYMDKCVGRLVSALEELGLRENTIVLFTTDNGTAGAITGTRDGDSVNGAKGSLSEAGVCAPFIVNGPELVPVGVKSNALTDFTDLLPTFVELGGGTAPDDLTIDGVLIAPVILGKQDDVGREWIMALGDGAAKLTRDGVQTAHPFNARVIRDQQFKVWVSRAKEIDKLYDLHADPMETNKLIDSGDAVHRFAIQKFQAVVDSLPEKDASPLYQPREPKPRDQRLKAK